MGKRRTGLANATVVAIRAHDDYWAAVDAAKDTAGICTVVNRPEGGKTIREYAERYSLPITTAGYQLQSMLSRGQMRRVRVKLPDTNGRLSPTWVYVPCQR